MERSGAAPTADVDTLIRGTVNVVKRWIRNEGPPRFQHEMDRRMWREDLTFDEWVGLFFPAPDFGLKFRRLDDALEVELPCREAFGALSTGVATLAPRLGWFVVTTNPQRYRVILQARQGKKVEVPPFLYHVTDASNVPSILRRGLIPRHRGEDADVGLGVTHRRYPDRVYLARDRRHLEKLIDAFVMRDAGSGWQGETLHSPYRVLRVDTSKTLPGTKFYEDPDYRQGVYTHTNIPAAAITVSPNDFAEDLVTRVASRYLGLRRVP